MSRKVCPDSCCKSHCTQRASAVFTALDPLLFLPPSVGPLYCWDRHTCNCRICTDVSLAAANKSLKRGVKEVVKALRKSPIPAANAPITTPAGIVVLAADISPMDVISHIPVLCEDHGIPYVYVTSRAELGSAGATKRPTSVVMVVPKSSGKSKKKDGESEGDEDFSKVYDELLKIVEKETKRVKV